ncbi:microtubule-associated protein futsch [Anabrus simplex]|uniref:microtubule-associated protein futsch n=1 Tax=Anabrus simplex TaxID=316456 RepID=UPI0035A30C6F
MNTIQGEEIKTLSFAYDIVILSDSAEELEKLLNGFLSWNVDNAHVDLEKELQALTNQAPEGEEARNGERLIQYATENLVTEVLIHPQLNTLLQCIRNLLSSFTRHRHLIHAGYTFAGNGSWILQDGTFSLADFIDAFQETEVQRVLRAYENCITVDVHCSPEGDWSTERLSKETFSRMCKVRVNPDDCLTAGGTAIGNFMNYMSPFLRPASIEQLLEPSDVVGNIRFSHPTLYVFPGGQGDAALFGINGFNMLVDGGFARKACFWDFARHLDRLDAVLMTRLNNGNINGIAAVLRRKKISHVYPQIGHFFSNLQERRHCTSPDGDKDRDPLLVNLADEGHEMVLNLRHLQLRPHPCYRDGSHIEPVNLYHKVGHGKLDMYIISPARDSREVKEFLMKWNSNDPHLFSSHSKKDVSKEFHFPLQNLISICALLVWQPANPADTITRILFPGSTPQHKIFEGLDKLRNLEFLKYPVCSARSLSPSASTVGISSRVSSKQRSAPAVIDKLLPGEGVKASSKTGASETNKQPPTPKAATIPVASITEVKQTKPATALVSTPVSLTKTQPQAKPKPEKVTSKQEPTKPKTEIIKSMEGEKTSTKMEKVTKTSVEVTKTKVEHKAKTETKTSVTKTRTESKPPRSIERKSQKVSATSTAKSSPTTPKKSIEAKVNGVVSKTETVKTTRTSSKTRPSPTATPAKSTKEANNRKVVESKYHVSRVSSVSRTSASKLTKKESQEITTKSERKPISRRPKTGSPSKAPASRPPGSPAKSSSAKSTPTPSVKSDKDGVIRKAKGEGEKITTDSSAVSTPSTVDQDTAALKAKGIEADEKIPQLINGDLTKEEKSVVEEIEDAIATVESRVDTEEKIEVTEPVATVSEVVESTTEEVKEIESTAEETEVETEEVVEEVIEEEGKDIEKESEAGDEEDIEQKKLLQERDDLEPTEEEKTEEIDEIEEIEAERPIDLRESLQAELQLEEAKQEGKEGVEEDEEEYLIIEKEEVEESVQEPESIESHVPEETGQQEVETEEEEGELQKHLRDEVESEKQLKEIITEEQEIKEEEEHEERLEHETIEREDILVVKKEISPVLEREELLKKVEIATKEEVERQAKEITEGPAPTTAQPEHEGLPPETKEQLEEEVQEIITSAKEIVTKSKLEAEGKLEETQVQPQKDKLKDQISDERKDTEETEDLKEISSTSPEEKLDISSEKNKEATEDTRDTDQKLEEEQDEGIEVKETGSREVPDQRYPAEESQPDEKFSTTIESAATTAPTLPEDERIPLDEIKEIVEEKYVKEETKEKEKPVEVPARLEQPTTLPQVVMPPGVGIFDPRVPHVIMHQRDIVKTPDEVADLPVHEEVDPGMYESDDFARDFQKPKDEIVSFKKHQEFEDTRQQSPEQHIQGELQLKYDEVARPVDDKTAEAKQAKALPVSDLEIKEGVAIEGKENLDTKPLVCPTTDQEIPLEKVTKEVLDSEELAEEKEPEIADQLPDQEIIAVDKEVTDKLQQEVDKQEKLDEHAKVDDKIKEDTETQEEEKRAELEDATKSEITDIESKDKDTEKEFLRQEIMKPDTKEVKDITAHFLEAEISSVKAEVIPVEKDEIMPKYLEEEMKDQQKDKALEGAEIALKEEVKEKQLEEKREIKLPTSKFDEKLLPTLFSGIVEVMADTVLDTTEIKVDQMEEEKDVKDTQEKDKLQTELSKEVHTSGVIEKDVQEKEDTGTHLEEILQPPSGLSATYLEIIEKLQKDTPSPVDAKPDLAGAEPQKGVDAEKEESKPEIVKIEKSPTEEVSLPEEKTIKEAEETLKTAALSEPIISHIDPSEPEEVPDEIEAKPEIVPGQKSPAKDIVMPEDKSPELIIEHKEEEITVSESEMQKETDKIEELRTSSEILSKYSEYIQDLESTEEKDKPIQEVEKDKDFKKEEEVEFTAKKIDEVTKIKEKELIKTEITEVKMGPEEKESKITDEVEEAPCVVEKVPEVQELLVPSKSDEEEKQAAEAKGKEKPDEQEQEEEEPKEKVIHKEEEKETIIKLDRVILDTETKKVDEVEVSDIPKVSTEEPEQKETEVKLVTEGKISMELSEMKPSEITHEVQVKQDTEEESIKIEEREPTPEEKERIEIDAEYLTKEEEDVQFHDDKTLTTDKEVTKIEVTKTEKKSLPEKEEAIEDKQDVELHKVPISVEEKELLKEEPIKTKDEKVKDEEMISGKEEEPLKVKGVETVEDEESAKIKQAESIIIKEEKPVKEEELVKDEKEEPVKIKDEETVKSKEVESVDIKEEKPAKVEEPLKTKEEDTTVTAKVDVTIKEDEAVRIEEKESVKIKEEKPVTKEEPDKAKEELLDIKEDVSLQKEEDETIKIKEDVYTKPREEQLKDEKPSKTEEKEPLPVQDSFKIKDDGTIKIKEEVPVPIKPTEEESCKIKDEEPGKTVEEEQLPIKKGEPLKIKEDEAVKIEEEVSVKLTAEDHLKITGEEPVKVTDKEPDEIQAATELDKEEHISIKEQKPTEANAIELIISKESYEEVEKKEHGDIEEVVTKITDEKLTKSEEVESKEKEEHIMEEQLLDAEKEGARKEKKEEISLIAAVVKEKEIGKKETEEKEYLKMEEKELPEQEKKIPTKPSPDFEEKITTDTKQADEVSERISTEEPVHDLMKDEHKGVIETTDTEPSADTRQPEEVSEKVSSKVSEYEPVKDDQAQRTKSPEIEEEVSTSTKVDIVTGLSPKKEEPAKSDQTERTQSPESEGLKESYGTEREKIEDSTKIMPPIKDVIMEKLLSEAEMEISVDAGVKVTLEEEEISPEPSAEVEIREEPTKILRKEDETLQKETPKPDVKDQFKMEEVKESETIEKKEIITEKKLTETKLIPDTDETKEEVHDKKFVKTDDKPSSEMEDEKPGKSMTPIKLDEPAHAEEIKEKDGETVLAEVKEFITKEIEKRVSEEEVTDVKKDETISGVEQIRILKTETVMEELLATISKLEVKLSDKEKDTDASKLDVTKEEKLPEKEKEMEPTDSSKLDVTKEKLPEKEKEREPTDSSKVDVTKEEKLPEKEKEREPTDSSKVDVIKEEKEEKLADKEKEKEPIDSNKVDVMKEEKLPEKEKEKEPTDSSKIDVTKEEKLPEKEKVQEPTESSKIEVTKEEKLPEKEKEKEPTDSSKIDVTKEEQLPEKGKEKEPADSSKVEVTKEEKLPEKEKEMKPTDSSKIEVTKEEKFPEEEKEKEPTELSKIDITKEEKLPEKEKEKEPADSSKIDVTKEEKLPEKEKEKEPADSSKIDVTKEEKLPEKEKEKEPADSSKVDVTKEEKLPEKEKEKEPTESSKIDITKEEKLPEKEKEKEPADSSKVDVTKEEKEEKLADKEKEKEPTYSSKIDITNVESKEPPPPKPASPLEQMEVEKEVEDRKSDDERLDEDAGDGEPPPSPGEEYIDSGLEEEPVYAKLEAPEHPEYVTVTPDSTPVSPKPLPGFKPSSLAQEEEDITMKISVADSKPSAPVMDLKETKSIVMEETTLSWEKGPSTTEEDAQITTVLKGKVTELKEKVSDEVKDVHEVLGEAKDKVDITTVSAEELTRGLPPSPVGKADVPLSSTEKVTTSVTKHVEEFLLAEKGMEESLRTEVSSSESMKQTKSDPEKEKDLSFVPEKETTVEKLVDEKVEKDELDEQASETASDSEEKLSQGKMSIITSTKESVIEALSTASISTSVITSSVVSAVSSMVTHISSSTKDVTSSLTDGTTEEKADVESSEKDIILAEKIIKEEIPRLTSTISEDSLERKVSASSSVTSEDIDITSEKTSESIIKEVSSTITATSAVAATATSSTVFTSSITPSLSSMKDVVTKESEKAATVTERVSKTEEREVYDSDLSTSVTVKRMVVTASSEDGGTETELCPSGSISFPSSTDTQLTTLSSETSEQDISTTTVTSVPDLSSTTTVQKDQVQPTTETVSTKTITSVKKVGDRNGDVHVSDQEVHSSGDEEMVGGKVITRKTTTTTTTRRIIRSVSDKESESDDDHKDSVTEETITGEDGRTITRRITRRYITKVIKKDGESDDDDRSSTGSVIMDDGPGSPRITTTKTSRIVTKKEGIAPDLELEGDDFSEGSDGGIVTTKTTRTTTTVTKKQSSDADGEVISTTTQEVVTGDGASKTTTITVKDEHGDVSVKSLTEPIEDFTSAGSSRFVDDVLKDSLCGVISSAEKMSKEIMEETTSKQVTEVDKIGKSSTEKLLTNGELHEKGTEKSKTTVTTSTVEITKHHDDVPGSPTVLGGAVAAMKKEVSELARSTTPGSDVLSDRDLDIGGPSTPHSDISSGQVSRAATNIWGGSEGRPDSRHCDSDEEDGPVSPMSVTSQVAHSPPSHFDFEMGDPHGLSKDLTKHSSAHHESSDMHKKTQHIMSTSMTSSLYGSLPTEQEQELLEHRNGHTMDDDSVDFERALYEHRAARGEDLAASSSPLTTHHYEIKQTEANGSPSCTVKYEHHYSSSGVNGQRLAGEHSLREFTEDFGNGNIAGAKQFEDVMNRNRDIKHVLEEKYNGKSDDGFAKFDMPLPSSYKKETFTTSSITPGTKLPSGTEERKTTVTTTTVISSSSGMEHDPMFHHQFPMPSMTGQTYPEPPQEFGQSSASKPEVKKDPIEGWGKPLGLPAPAPPPITDTQGDVNIGNTNKTTPKKEKKAMQIKKSMIMNENNKTSGGQTGKDSKTKSPESPVKQKGGSNKEIGRNTKSSVNPIYVDLTYVPHHGNSYYTSVEFFKKVRARYYVFSGTEPSREVYNALLEAKQTWEDKELEVTIIPTYDTDTLGYWVAENEDLLAKCKIDLSPSASRCTINLQDHETSCSAYRLEF